VSREESDAFKIRKCMSRHDYEGVMLVLCTPLQVVLPNLNTDWN